MKLFFYQHEKAEAKIERMAGDGVQRPSDSQMFPSHYLKLNILHTFEVLPSKGHSLLIEGHQSLIHLCILETRIFSSY